MTYTPFRVDHWGGLNLALDVTEVGAASAVGILNVDLRDPSVLRSRPPFQTVGPASALTAPLGLVTFDRSDNSSFIIAGHGTDWTAYNALMTFSVTSLTAVTTPEIRSPVRFGTPSDEYVFWGSDDGPMYFDGTTITSIASQGYPVENIGLMATSNRLILQDGVSSVRFSAAGDPLTYPGFFLEFTPGDGSAIQGIVNWQNDTYVFKEGRFFVITGESETTVGTPIFLYRTVDGFGTPVRPAVGDLGVYFFDGRTVYLTQGGPPTRVSDLIAPWFISDDCVLNGRRFDASNAALVVLNYSLGRLFLRVPVVPIGVEDAGVPFMTLVFDERSQSWSVWDIDARYVSTGFGNYNPQRSMFYLSVADAKVKFIREGTYENNDPVDGDDGGTSSPSWSYTSGTYDMGKIDRKVIRETDLLINSSKDGGGAGTNVTLTMFTDSGAASVAETPAVPGGTRNQPVQVKVRTAARGQRFNYGLTTSGTGVEVMQLTHRLRDGEEPK